MMYIKSIKLTNFRNYESQTVTLKDGLNVIVGKNASGKTNMIESVYCAGLGRSPRTSKYREMIKWKCENALIEVVVAKKYRDYKINFLINSSDKKKVSIDDIPLSRLTQLLGVLNVVFFSPDELKLIKEGPSERRKFMDVSLSQQSKNYYNALSKYNNILAQRNKLLKSNYSEETLKQCLYSWDIGLAEHGARIIKYRYNFIAKINELAKEKHLFLTSNQENLTLKYECEFEDIDIKELQEKFFEKLTKSIERDKYLMHTSVGVQKDDIKVDIDGVDIRKFGSQGQQRTSALSLKLAEISLFKNEMGGESPVLILDDVLSELDDYRSTKLLESIENIQTLITCTNFDYPIKYNEIKIANGKVVE